MNTYMGTVSLKNNENGAAGFAITVRKGAIGKGFSKYAMSEIILICTEKLKLKRVNWCVSPENKCAVRFYNKNGYTQIDFSKPNIFGRLTTATPTLHLAPEDAPCRVNRRQIIIFPVGTQEYLALAFLRGGSII